MLIVLMPPSAEMVWPKVPLIMIMSSIPSKSQR